MITKRIYGDVSPQHESAFLYIKGAMGCKSNGEALEKMIERVMPEIKKEVKPLKGSKRG